MPNIYEPPSSSLDDVAGAGDAHRQFYVVAPLKFAALYLCTFGMYKVYWFYKNWSRFKAHTQESIWPVMRGLFTIFFAHALFREVESTLERERRDHVWNPGLIATLYVIIQIASNVMDRLPDSTDKIVIPLELFVVLPAIGVLLYRAQCAINIACGDPKGSVNAHLNWANYAWMALGTLVMLLAAIGLVVETPALQ